ncbi:hypothetical protein NGRA_1561 [Nosema granulosis]|uniref:Uncharacterized protein n=1 Tax=Nosema granulosis TaxID=83296 RepID=A0A9P6KZ16_9MICR|nr:hypothetical protein NGRA_1561 [Nosema granulosis]
MNVIAILTLLCTNVICFGNNFYLGDKGVSKAITESINENILNIYRARNIVEVRKKAEADINKNRFYVIVSKTNYIFYRIFIENSKTKKKPKETYVKRCFKASKQFYNLEKGIFEEIKKDIKEHKVENVDIYFSINYEYTDEEFNTLTNEFKTNLPVYLKDIKRQNGLNLRSRFLPIGYIRYLKNIKHTEEHSIEFFSIENYISTTFVFYNTTATKENVRKDVNERIDKYQKMFNVLKEEDTANQFMFSLFKNLEGLSLEDVTEDFITLNTELIISLFKFIMNKKYFIRIFEELEDSNSDENNSDNSNSHQSNSNDDSNSDSEEKLDAAFKSIIDLNNDNLNIVEDLKKLISNHKEFNIIGKVTEGNLSRCQLIEMLRIIKEIERLETPACSFLLKLFIIIARNIENGKEIFMSEDIDKGKVYEDDYRYPDAYYNYYKYSTSSIVYEEVRRHLQKQVSEYSNDLTLKILKCLSEDKVPDQQEISNLKKECLIHLQKNINEENTIPSNFILEGKPYGVATLELLRGNQQ